MLYRIDNKVVREMSSQTGNNVVKIVILNDNKVVKGMLSRTIVREMLSFMGADITNR